MKSSNNVKGFNEYQENLNISEARRSDLITQIKEYKDELLQDIEEMVYTSGQSIPDSFFNLSELIDKL